MFPPLAPQPDAPTTTAQQVVSDQNATVPKGEDKVKKLYDEFRTRVDVCKVYRRKLIANWTVSIDYRRGKPFQSQTDEDQVAVNLDWSLTKAKTASLFSQVPKVRLSHGGDTLPKTAPWSSKLESKINDTLLQAGIETAMDECLPDCINAAGIGVVLVSYDVLTEDRQVPKHDPTLEDDDEVDPSVEPEMETIPHVLDHKYTTQRISPADLLWPINFTGANFDDAPWVGRSGRVTWPEAMQKFGLTEEDKDKVVGEGHSVLDRLTHDVERDKIGADDMVTFDEIFYKEYKYSDSAQSYSSIHHLVFVTGKEKPVIDETWNGQKAMPDGTVIGAQAFPIRILTLTYLTDETIPPSDSAIGRPQVDEINKARTQMIRQRERSLPIRWFDVNRVDPTIQQGLMRGTWQAMIPVQGEGSRTIGEVTRATMPQETFMFDKIAKADLNEEWVISQNGAGQDEAAKGEPNQNKAPYNTQAGRERAKVASFFVGIAQVLGGLLCLYEDPASFGEGFDPLFSKLLTFSVLSDSTVLLDASQKLARLNQFINTYAKSGWINIEPVLQEIAILTGLDPALVIKAPQPKPPVEPNISLRLTGVEDMLNPLTLAFLMKSGQAPDAALIEQAKGLIQQAVVPPQGMQMPSGVQPQGGLPMLPEGQGGAPTPPGVPPGTSGAIPPPVPGPPPGSPVPSPQPPKLGEAHPNWATMPAVNKRSEGNQK